MRGVVIAIVFFVLGILLAPYIPVLAEQRAATSDENFDSIQRVPFDKISVYPDRIQIDQPGIRYAKVTSNSMAPIITDKSTVFEKTPISPEEIKIGDTISYYEPTTNSVILHNVIEIQQKEGKTSYKTKGLANEKPDPWTVPYENVKGIMIGTFK